MPYSRREFLLGLSAIAGTAFLNSARAEPYASGEDYLLVSSKKNICKIRMKDWSLEMMPVSFEAHSFFQNPKKPERIWAVGKFGRRMIDIDFHKNKIITTIENPPEEQFLGHGVFMPEGDMIFSVRQNLKTQVGYLTGYDARSGKVISDYRVAPGGMHDCLLMPDNTILVSSYGRTLTVKPVTNDFVYSPVIEKSSIIRIDPRNGTVLDKKPIDRAGDIVAHFARTKSGALIGLGMPPEGKTSNIAADKGVCVYFCPPGGDVLNTVPLPEEITSRLRREMLSVAINEDKHVAALTNPKGNTLLFIDTRDGKYLGYSNMKRPLSVSFDARTEKFICGGGMGIVELDETTPPKPLMADNALLKKEPKLFNGIHSLIVRM